MKNQINMGDRNVQQIGQSPVSQNVKVPGKQKANYQLISLIVLICFLLFGVGGYYIGTQTQNKTLKRENILPTPIVTNPPETTVSPTNTPVTQITNGPRTLQIPSFWLTYDKDYNVVGHYTFRYPPEFAIDDGDPDSSSLRVYKKSNEGEAMWIDSLRPYGFNPYTGGSRREWFLKSLNETGLDYSQPTPKPYNYSQLQFTEVSFAGSINYLKVTNWPKDSFFSGEGTFYFAIENGVEFKVVSTLKDRQTENMMFSSLSARKPVR